MPRSLLLVLALLVSLVATACSGPEPPKLTPERGRITSVGPNGLGLEVTLDAYNPNSIGLTARSLKGKVTLDGKHHVGDVVVPTTVSLPAKKHTKITVPLSMKLGDLSALGLLAASQRDVPYKVEGTFALGGEKVNFDVPFTIEGIMTHAELVQATMNSLPKLPIPLPVIK
jgi:LEA14-like dessication related protein